MRTIVIIVVCVGVCIGLGWWIGGSPQRTNEKLIQDYQTMFAKSERAYDSVQIQIASFITAVRQGGDSSQVRWGENMLVCKIPEISSPFVLTSRYQFSYINEKKEEAPAPGAEDSDDGGDATNESGD